MKLNKEELLVGIGLTALVSPFPLAVLAMPICGLLWALSGAGESKLYRRLGVPVIWALTIGSVFAFLCIPIAFGFLSLGYGIPDVNDNEGSKLGAYFLKLTKSVLWANILTRGVIYGGAVIPFVIARILS